MTKGEKQMAEKAEHYQEKYGQLPEAVGRYVQEVNERLIDEKITKTVKNPLA